MSWQVAGSVAMFFSTLGAGVLVLSLLDGGTAGTAGDIAPKLVPLSDATSPLPAPSLVN